MNSERIRAKELGIPDPINANKEITDQNYNDAIDFLLDKIAETRSKSKISCPQLSVVLATHNKYSIVRALNGLAARNIPSQGGYVHFAQLMGMQDGVAFALSQNGYSSYKYIPYGPVKVTIPYLIRRSQENSSVLGGASADRQNLFNELARRVHGKSSSSLSSPSPVVYEQPKVA